MKDDELLQVVQAFRDVNTADALDSASIRRRVLGFHLRQPKRRVWAVWFLPAALLLLGSAALAANGPFRPGLARVLAWVDRTVTSSGAGERAPVAARSTTNGAPSTDSPIESRRADIPPSPADSPPAKADIAVTSEYPPRRDSTRPDRRPLPPSGRAERPIAPKQPASSPPVHPPGDQDADLQLYRAAHQRHFQEKNSTAALAAWDAYLAAFPKGRLAAEAHFNRAICLWKVGRAKEAEAVLEQIASGALGGYRSSRAADLVDILRKRRASSGSD